MSTELYPFTGDEQQSMAFTPVLDGSVYDCQIKWNIAAQRWYLNVSDNSGSRLLTTPMIESTTSTGINLIAGIFSATAMYWRGSNGQIEVTS